MDFEAYEMPQGTSQPNTRAQQMLDVIKDGIENDDLEFAALVANRQDLLRPVEIAVWMEGEYYATEDPGQIKKWRAALQEHLDSLKGYEFEDDEKETLLEIEEGLKNDEAAYGDPEEDDWLAEKFTHGLSQDEFDQVWNLPEFRPVKMQVIGSGGKVRDLDIAIQMISRSNSPEEDRMRQLLDHFVFLIAEEYASGGKTGLRQLNAAKTYINVYASSEEAKSRMRSAIDKYVFEEAKSYAPIDIEKAHDVILDHGSTKARQEDMLRRLGTN
jgi:hypothetical protein